MQSHDQILGEIAEGSGIYLTAAARRFPPHRRGRPVTLSCLVRWITDGVRGPDGRRVRLEAARLAGRWVTTEAALERFLAAQTPSVISETDAAPAPRPPAARRRAAERAARELDRIGI